MKSPHIQSHPLSNLIFKIKHKKEEELHDNTIIEKEKLKELLQSLREHNFSRKNIEKLLYHYYKFYPDDYVEGMTWMKKILSKNDIKVFIEKGILMESDDGEMIKLGPAGLSMISMWHTENMTKFLLIITICSLVVAIASFIISFNTLQKILS